MWVSSGLNVNYLGVFIVLARVVNWGVYSNCTTILPIQASVSTIINNFKAKWFCLSLNSILLWWSMILIYVLNLLTNMQLDKPVIELI